MQNLIGKMDKEIRQRNGKKFIEIQLHSNFMKILFLRFGNTNCRNQKFGALMQSHTFIGTLFIFKFRFYEEN